MCFHRPGLIGVVYQMRIEHELFQLFNHKNKNAMATKTTKTVATCLRPGLEIIYKIIENIH